MVYGPAMTLPPKGRSGRPGRPAASDKAARPRRSDGKPQGRDGYKSAPRDDARTGPRDGARYGARDDARPAPRDGAKYAPRDGAKYAPHDGGKPAPRDGGKPAPRDGAKYAPRDGARPAPRDGGKYPPRDGAKPAARDGARRDQRERPPVEGKLTPRPAAARPAPVRGAPAGQAQAAATARPYAGKATHKGTDRPFYIKQDGKPAPAKPFAKAPGAKAPAAVRAPADDGTAREGERIAKLLARAGVASRREVERLIAEGRVKLDDVVVSTPATILRNLRGVSVDGRLIAAAAPTRVFRFHKPSGLITAERDPAGRPTIYNALRNALPPGTPRVIPVGRLDLNTEGLLLLTNDGELKRALELPATGIPRTYRARTFGDITQAQLEDLMEGVEIDGVRYGSIDANMERRTGRNQWIEMTLTEGKNREVRRVLEHLGLQVSRLLRTAYGPFELADLPRGGAEEVPQVLVERFRKSLKTMPTSSPTMPREDD